VLGRQVERLRAPADHDSDARTKQAIQPFGEGGPSVGQDLRRDAVGRAGDRDDIVAGEAIMGGGDDHIKAVGRQSRVLGLDHKRAAVAQSPDGKRQGQCRPTGGDPQVRPGRAGLREGRSGGRVQHPPGLEGNRQPVEDRSPADALDGDNSRRQPRHGLGEAKRLILHAGPAVGDDLDAKRTGAYFHSTLRIS
jgi:hypothetical protein